MGTNKLIDTNDKFVPTIYAYTTPDIPKHNGWTKIGDTKRGAETRIEEQTFTADIDYKLEWELNASFEGNPPETFRDVVFHAYLQKQGIERGKRPNKFGKLTNTEWFHILPIEAKLKLIDFRCDRGIIKQLGVIPYSLRDEQCEAVDKTMAYFISHDGKNPEFLWNAKPRFGKTLTAYDLCVALEAKNILIVTNRPAISNSWYSDYAMFFGPESGYYFVSSTDSLKDKPGVISRRDYVNLVTNSDENIGCIEFVSLQDLKGSKYFGGHFDKLEHIYKGTESGAHKGITWDVLIIDEAHEGVDTFKTDKAFNQISRKYTLHLSGTPFKALANDKFESSAIFNWTYADEQKAKAEWNDDDRSNPYSTLPRMNLLTYKMSDIVLGKLSDGADFDEDGDKEAYAFDLNEFFKTKSDGSFIHEKDVDKFLDALVTQTKFPFSEEYRDELKHTLWVLKYVASAKALAKKLNAHPVFGENGLRYKIVLAAGDGKIVDDETELNDDEMDKTIRSSYDKVVNAIADNERTITLSVGQLTTGITIPEWTGVMMLSNMKSPALYMQAAFRAQNPCVFRINGESYQKKNAYIFDFDPARTLDIFEQFANGLYSDTASGKGDTDIRKKHVRDLINFFPVYGEDDDGEMVELDAEKVLSIPRSIHAKEVVRRGFMCNFLFQNISGIFAAPSVVTSILNKLEPIKQPTVVTKGTKDELNINDKGEVEIPNETIIGTAVGIFGDKLYSDIHEDLSSAVTEAQKIINENGANDPLNLLKETLHTHLTETLTAVAHDYYGRDMTKATQKQVMREINRNSDKEIEQHYGDYSIDKTVIEDDRKKAVEMAILEGRYEDVDKINNEAIAKQKETDKKFASKMNKAIQSIIESAGNTIANAVETDKKEKEKKSIEDTVRDHLRGFSRTIPSFLMGYGDDNTCLENFDKIVPADVFYDVTGITLNDFVFLRDGGDYTNEETGETEHFEGRLFDPVVFNDSVKEFMNLRDKLADYFDENAKEDIFDYIPPQKTNQIYTPRKIVKQMVDYLERENPGCFDDPYATFIDLYMKSGLYITEIVKRLFNSKRLKEEMPDDQERLAYIFEAQMFGLAPTEIIYRIATNYILGFSKTKPIRKHNFKQADALPYAKDNKLNDLLESLYGFEKKDL